MFYQFSGLSAAIATDLWLDAVHFRIQLQTKYKTIGAISLRLFSPKEDLCILSTTKNFSAKIADIKF